MIRTARQLIATCTLWGMLGVLLFCAGPTHAEQTTATETAETEESLEALRDPEALAELARATDFLTALPRFQIRAHVIQDVIQADGRRLQFEKQGEIFLQRPDRLHADVYLDDGRHRQFWYDGAVLSIAERSRNLHTRVKTPPTIDGMLDMLEELFDDPMPLADLLYSDLAPLEQRALEADVVGDSLVGGRPCLHLAFRGETVDWQLWVEQGEKPLIRKLAISYREIAGVPQYVAWIDDWEIPQQFDANRFTFVVPEGSQWISVLVPMQPPGEEGGEQ